MRSWAIGDDWRMSGWMLRSLAAGEAEQLDDDVRATGEIED